MQGLTFSINRDIAYVAPCCLQNLWITLETQCVFDILFVAGLNLKVLIVVYILLGRLEAVRPGDCVVAFSRQRIFQIKAEIERKTKHKCSIIYGGLPPCKYERRKCI